ncbi:hypothetical protein [Nostoc sp.]|uniref:hypothetical protein n=1 Tax=Nostoc sp. TaxID=1180 RepID=UPI002FF49611
MTEEGYGQRINNGILPKYARALSKQSARGTTSNANYNAKERSPSSAKLLTGKLALTLAKKLGGGHCNSNASQINFGMGLIGFGMLFLSLIC